MAKEPFAVELEQEWDEAIVFANDLEDLQLLLHSRILSTSGISPSIW
jgi:hypothetical protein